MRPMLAENVSMRTIGTYLQDDDYVLQQKIDGDRLMVTVDDGAVTVLNRDGQVRMNPTPRALVAEFGTIPRGRWVFDGELLDGELWLFDLPAAGDAVGPHHPYAFRVEILERMFGLWAPRPVIRLLPTARTQWAKERLLDRVMGNGGEGVVLKRLDAPYLPGKRSRGMLKAKDTKTIDCVVSGVAVGGHNNCHVAVFEGGVPVEVGSCAMLGKAKVAVGDVVEVRYLYADTGRRLVQTSFLRVRTDKPASECTIDQLMFTDRTVITDGFGVVATTRTLGRQQRRILVALHDGPRTLRAIVDEAGGTESAARSALRRLGERGLVDRQLAPNRKDHVYFATDQGSTVVRELQEQMIQVSS